LIDRDTGALALLASITYPYAPAKATRPDQPLQAHLLLIDIKPHKVSANPTGEYE